MFAHTAHSAHSLYSTPLYYATLALLACSIQTHSVHRLAHLLHSLPLFLVVVGQLKCDHTVNRFDGNNQLCSPQQKHAQRVAQNFLQGLLLLDDIELELCSRLRLKLLEI